MQAAMIGMMVAAGVTLGGCGGRRENAAYEAELKERLAQQGLTPGPVDGVRWWRDSANETTFVLGYPERARDRHAALMLLKKDRPEPMVVDLAGINLTKQWVDSDGRVWSVPEFVSAEERARMTVWSIDSSSGLFVICDLDNQEHPFHVGRMNKTDGWVFSDILPPQVKSAVYVGQRGEQIVVSEGWSFKVHGVRELRPYHWVYAPDPGAAGRYRRVDSYR